MANRHRIVKRLMGQRVEYMAQVRRRFWWSPLTEWDDDKEYILAFVQALREHEKQVAEMKLKTIIEWGEDEP